MRDDSWDPLGKCAVYTILAQTCSRVTQLGCLYGSKSGWNTNSSRIFCENTARFRRSTEAESWWIRREQSRSSSTLFNPKIFSSTVFESSVIGKNRSSCYFRWGVNWSDLLFGPILIVGLSISTGSHSVLGSKSAILRRKENRLLRFGQTQLVVDKRLVCHSSTRNHTADSRVENHEKSWNAETAHTSRLWLKIQILCEIPNNPSKYYCTVYFAPPLTLSMKLLKPKYPHPCLSFWWITLPW